MGMLLMMKEIEGKGSLSSALNFSFTSSSNLQKRSFRC